jgi:hypothetical protein
MSPTSRSGLFQNRGFFAQQQLETANASLTASGELDEAELALKRHSHGSRWRFPREMIGNGASELRQQFGLNRSQGYREKCRYSSPKLRDHERSRKFSF